jgi:hypothetical protein
LKNTIIDLSFLEIKAMNTRSYINEFPTIYHQRFKEFMNAKKLKTHVDIETLEIDLLHTAIFDQLDKCDSQDKECLKLSTTFNMLDRRVTNPLYYNAMKKDVYEYNKIRENIIRYKDGSNVFQ